MRAKGDKKVCSKCKEEKTIFDFYHNKTTCDGLEYACKVCSKNVSKQWRENNPETVKNIKNKWKNKNKNKINGYHKKWRKSKKISYLLGDGARHKVMIAIKKCIITRMPCIKCGRKAQAHHEDYNKPLDVIWLCPKHHQELHRNKLLGN